MVDLELNGLWASNPQQEFGRDWNRPSEVPPGLYKLLKWPRSVIRISKRVMMMVIRKEVLGEDATYDTHNTSGYETFLAPCKMPRRPIIHSSVNAFPSFTHRLAVARFNSQGKKVHSQNRRSTKQCHRWSLTSNDEEDGDHTPYAEVETQGIF